MVTLEVKQLAEKRMYAEAETNPQVDILWHTVPFGQRTPTRWTFWRRSFRPAPAGSTRGWCWAAASPPKLWAGQDSREVGGLLQRQRRGQGRPHAARRSSRAIYDELEKLKKEDVPPEELQKVKNNFAAGEYRRLHVEHARSCSS